MYNPRVRVMQILKPSEIKHSVAKQYPSRMRRSASAVARMSCRWGGGTLGHEGLDANAYRKIRTNHFLTTFHLSVIPFLARKLHKSCVMIQITSVCLYVKELKVCTHSFNDGRWAVIMLNRFDSATTQHVRYSTICLFWILFSTFALLVILSQSAAMRSLKQIMCQSTSMALIVSKAL